MIIFGTRTKPTKAEALLGCLCTNCGKSNLVRKTFWSYFHLYWIPTFPYRRYVETNCPSCGQTLSGKELSEHLRHAPSADAAALANPLWMFTGLMLLAAVGFLAANSIAQRKEQVLQFAADPHQADRIIVDLAKLNPPVRTESGQGRYGVFEVAEVDAQKVSFRVSKASYKNTIESGRVLDNPATASGDYFGPNLYVLNRDMLMGLAEAEGVRGVSRSR